MSARKKLVAPVILDGGMGHTLRRMGISVSGEIGSAQRFSKVALANLQQPELVIAAHESFINAGADVITANNYAAVPNTLQSVDADVGRVIAAAVDCAVKARNRQEVKIAASIPPLHASYRPDQVASFEENLSLYRDLVKELRSTGSIDLFLCETMSTVDEARAAATAVLEEGGGLPLWVSWTLGTDGRLRSGETVAEAVHAVAVLDKDNSCLQACLFNCCTVEAIDKALDELLASVPEGCAVGAYANSFAEQRLGVGKNTSSNNDADEKKEYRQDLSPAAFSAVAKGWLNRGCTIVGGCCGIFPEHIQELATSVKEQNRH